MIRILDSPITSPLISPRCLSFSSCMMLVCNNNNNNSAVICDEALKASGCNVGSPSSYASHPHEGSDMGMRKEECGCSCSRCSGGWSPQTTVSPLFRCDSAESSSERRADDGGAIATTADYDDECSSSNNSTPTSMHHHHHHRHRGYDADPFVSTDSSLAVRFVLQSPTRRHAAPLSPVVAFNEDGDNNNSMFRFLMQDAENCGTEESGEQRRTDNKLASMFRSHLTQTTDDGDSEEEVASSKGEDEELEVAGVTSDGELMYRSRGMRTGKGSRKRRWAIPPCGAETRREDEKKSSSSTTGQEDDNIQSMPAVPVTDCDLAEVRADDGYNGPCNDAHCHHLDTKQMDLEHEMESNPYWMFTPAQSAHVQQLMLRARDRENDVYAPYVAAELTQWLGYRDTCMMQAELLRLSSADLECLR